MTTSGLKLPTQIFGLLLLGLLIISCQSAPKPPTKESRVSIVSVKKAAYSMSASKNVVSWKPKGGHVIPSEKIKIQNFEPMLKDAIIDALERKGYAYNQSPEQGKLLISYLVALESELSDDQIVQRFGLMPGFSTRNPDTEQYQKGTIVVDIYDTTINSSIWRGAVQGFAHKEMSENDRRKRVTAIMHELFGQFPSLL